MKGCRTLENNEIKVILDKLNIRDKLLILTGLTFGTRISESLELTFSKVSGSYLKIRSKKGSENVTFPIPESYKKLVHQLKEYYEEIGIETTDNTPLFVSRKGINQSINRQQASRIITGVCEELGIEGKINTHSFRKTFVTSIYNMTNFDIAQTKVYSRHKNLANLDYYINTSKETNLIHNLQYI